MASPRTRQYFGKTASRHLDSKRQRRTRIRNLIIRAERLLKQARSCMTGAC